MTQNSHNDSDPIQESRTRKNRQTINLDIIKRVRKQIEQNICIKTIATEQGLSLQCAYKLIGKIADGATDKELIGPKKGRRCVESSDIKSRISQILLKDASFTQLELSQELQNFGITRSPSAVSKILKKMEYTRKRLIKIPEARNTPNNIDNRQTYAREINFIPDSNFVFLDETGLNLHITRNYGYSPKNSKAYKIIKGSRGMNISCMVAIKKEGVLAFKIKDGAYNAETFLLFIEEKLLPHFQINPNDVLVMDNCRFHHSRNVINFLEAKNIIYRFLPPYSPQLNPIEEYFSHFKSVLCSIHPSPNDREELKRRICNILQNERIDFSGWFANMRNYIQKALARHEFI